MNGGDAGRARRMRILAVLTLAMVFVAGGLVGAAVERGRVARTPDRPLPRAERRGPPPMFAEGSPLAEKLGLTPAQRDSIERIARRDRVRADSVFRETRRAMRLRLDSTLTAVEDVLTPEQRAEWRRMRREMRMRDLGEGRGRRAPGMRGRPGMPPSHATPAAETSSL